MEIWVCTLVYPDRGNEELDIYADTENQAKHKAWEIAKKHYMDGWTKITARKVNWSVRPEQLWCFECDSPLHLCSCNEGVK